MMHSRPSDVVFRIVATVDPVNEGDTFSLLDADGKQIRTDAVPQRLVDYALEASLCTFVRHDYNLVEAEASKHAGRGPKWKAPR